LFPYLISRQNYILFSLVGQPTVGLPTTGFSLISYTKCVDLPIVGGECFMRLVDAVYKRILGLAKERNMSINALANLSGVPRPTIVTMTKSSTVKLSTIYGICDGLKITLQDFFNSPLFKPENIID